MTEVQTLTEAQLDAKFGITADELERRAAEYEADDWSQMEFGEVIEGLPETKEKMDVFVSCQIQPSRAKAIDNAAKSLGINRSEFIRRAIEHELVAVS